LDPEDLPLNQWNIEEMCGVFFESPTLAPLRRSTTRIRPQLVPKHRLSPRKAMEVIEPWQMVMLQS
jgi:hypothetical protein